MINFNRNINLVQCNKSIIDYSKTLSYSNLSLPIQIVTASGGAPLYNKEK